MQLSFHWSNASIVLLRFEERFEFGKGGEVFGPAGGALRRDQRAEGYYCTLDTEDRFHAGVRSNGFVPTNASNLSQKVEVAEIGDEGEFPSSRCCVNNKCPGLTSRSGNRAPSPQLHQ